ncbi:MAG: GIY-YIG nuclease family protein [Hyphomonadaceae bacterium]
MDKQRKRALTDAYRETKKRAGVYAVVCSATGARWVSATPDLSKQQNAIWFQLRTGGFPNRALQAAWNEHGEEAFVYEALAELPDAERSAYALRADLKTLDEEWRKKLNAPRVTG